MRGQLQTNFFVINMNTTYLFAWLHTMSISYQNRVMDTQKYNFHTKLHLCHIFVSVSVAISDFHFYSFICTYLFLPFLLPSIYLISRVRTGLISVRQHLATRSLRTGGQLSYPTLSLHPLYVFLCFFLLFAISNSV